MVVTQPRLRRLGPPALPPFLSSTDPSTPRLKITEHEIAEGKSQTPCHEEKVKN
jgi:hypothetical protein